MDNESKDDKLLCPVEKKADLEIANQKLVVEYLADFVNKGRTRITEGDVLEIHRLTIERIYPCAGTFRDARTEVTITGTDHRPVHPSQVRLEINDFYVACPILSTIDYRHNHLANLPSSRTKHPKIRVRRRIFSQTA